MSDNIGKQYRINTIVEFDGWDESGFANIKLPDGTTMKISAEIFLSLYSKVEENEPQS